VAFRSSVPYFTLFSYDKRSGKFYKRTCEHSTSPEEPYLWDNERTVFSVQYRPTPCFRQRSWGDYGHFCLVSACQQGYCKSNQPISLKLGVMIGSISQ